MTTPNQIGGDEPPPRFSAPCRAAIRSASCAPPSLSAAVAHLSRWRAAFTMKKARKIKEQIEVLDRHLAAAKEYVARDVNIRGTASWLHLGDWKGKSGHPLWMKNHMIPSTQRSRAGKVRALEKLATKAKEKRLKERRRNDAHA